jgi:hypothetical protein
VTTRPKKAIQDMDDAEFEAWLKKNHITGMAAVNASASRRLAQKARNDLDRQLLADAHEILVDMNLQRAKVLGKLRSVASLNSLTGKAIAVGLAIELGALHTTINTVLQAVELEQDLHRKRATQA